MEETLGKRIVYHRKRLALTQDQLAEKLGVTAQAVSKWENDQSCPDIATLPLLSDIFGISTDALLGRAIPTVEAEVVPPEEDAAQDQKEQNKVSFHWDGGRKGSVSAALWVLAVGAVYLCSLLLGWGMSFWQAFWPTSLLCFGLSNLYPKFSFLSLGCILVGSYGFASHFSLLPADLDSSIIWAVLLIILGISLFADGIKKKKGPSFTVKNGDKKFCKSLDLEEDTFSYDASFGSDRTCIDLQVLRRGEIDTSFGDYVLDLSRVVKVADHCTLDADNSFGQLTVLVPRRFAVRPNSDTSFAGFSVVGQPQEYPDGTIYLNASASFGEITIKYV